MCAFISIVLPVRDRFCAEQSTVRGKKHEKGDIERKYVRYISGCIPLQLSWGWKPENVGEHIKYGIYYDDDYNYLQHLRSLNEIGCEVSIPVWELEEREQTLEEFKANGIIFGVPLGGLYSP
uniref:Protein LTV1 homolog n=1 Tax=Parascaris equorum TaxID=6256 RepID=A0A914S397_PAREQ